MTLEQILTIEAIVKEGSFKAAADFLHKSQPSISMAVKKLEEEYQITLFSRDEYRPSLTSDGELFYQKSLELLKEYRELDYLARQISRGVEPEIRVSIDAVSPVSLVLKFLKKFFQNHPDTKLVLKFEVLSGTLERLIDNEVDLAITPKSQKLDQFDLKHLTNTKMVSVISTELIKKQKKVSDAFLKNHNQIILADSARKIEKTTTGILAGGKSLTVNDIGFKKELIVNGLGWGGLPIDLVKNEVQKGKLEILSTETTKERDLDIFMVKLKNKPMGPVLKELWNSVEKDGI